MLHDSSLRYIEAGRTYKALRRGTFVAGNFGGGYVLLLMVLCLALSSFSWQPACLGSSVLSFSYNLLIYDLFILPGSQRSLSGLAFGSLSGYLCSLS